MAELTIYTTPTCPWCRQAKKYLAEKGVAFAEKDVTRNGAWIEELRTLSGQMGVPVITDGTRVVVGFNRAAIDELLAG
jgi:glutaredoxin-like YruB-family protein